MHHEHMLLFEQVGNKCQVVFGNIQAGMRVERSLRRYQLYMWSPLGPLHGELRASAQFAQHFFEVVLRAFERWPDGVLEGIRGRQPGAQQPEYAFHVRIQYLAMARRYCPSNSPSGT